MLGTLDQRAKLLAPVRTPDGGGGASVSWTELAEIWIALEAASGGEDFGASRLESRARYRATLRRRGDVVAGMRLQTSAHLLAVLAILDDGPREPFMTLLCEDAA
jgi:SPP1 family predicted phage head-tail adaptor